MASYYNGVASIATALWTIIDVYWVLTIGGLIAYFLWNILMIVLMVMIWRDAGAFDKLRD